MVLRFKIRFNRNKMFDVENWMSKENKDYLNSQKELGKIDDKVIDTLARELEQRFAKKGIIYDGNDIKQTFKRFREGWDFNYEFKDGDSVIIEWNNHPLIDYKDEQMAQVLYKFFKGSFSHIFKQGIINLIRFLKSFKDPNIILKPEENTIKTIMIKKQYEEINSKMKKIDMGAVINMEEL